MLMAYEVTRDLKTDEVEIETPLQKTKVKRLSGKKLGVVPILRAGLGMVEGMLNILPAAAAHAPSRLARGEHPARSDLRPGHT